MSTKKVLKKVESAIIRVCSDIEQKKGGSGIDKLDSISRLVNSYSRLLERVKKNEDDVFKHGDPDEDSMMGVIR